MSADLFRKYYKKLAREGWLKSLLYGLTAGFGTMAVLSAVCWFMGWKAFWVAIVVGVLIGVGGVYAFYKFKFQPTTKSIARRIDELGLEERIITMTELEGDDSYIARRQREDALQALNTVQASLIKVVVSVSVIVAVSVAFVLGAGFTTISGLTAAGILPSGIELLTPDDDGIVKKYQLEYGIQEGEGSLTGVLKQEVERGKNASVVIAVPEEEWIFIAWSDGLQNPYRHDLSVETNIKVFAIFQLAEVGVENQEKEDPPLDSPVRQPGDENPIPMPGADYEDINNVYNNKVHYSEVYPDAKEEVQSELASGSYQDSQKDIVNGYLVGIEIVVDEEEKEE